MEKTTRELESKFYENYPQYCDGTFRFKSCQTNLIVVLQKLSDTCDTEQFTKCCEGFRANKMKVIAIINKDKQNIQYNQTRNSCFAKTIEYIVGEIVEIDDFDYDLENYYSTGIHYFKNVIDAIRYERPFRE